MHIISALVSHSTLIFPLPRFLCTCHHSTTKLFVAGLSYDTNEPVLRDAFGQHGEIIEAEVICDHVTGNQGVMDLFGSFLKLLPPQLAKKRMARYWMVDAFG